MKKVLAFLLALSMCLVFVTGCTNISADDPAAKGAEFDVYLGKKVMDLDPAIAYTDDNAVKILNLIFPECQLQPVQSRDSDRTDRPDWEAVHRVLP